MQELMAHDTQKLSFGTYIFFSIVIKILLFIIDLNAALNIHSHFGYSPFPIGPMYASS